MGSSGRERRERWCQVDISTLWRENKGTIEAGGDELIISTKELEELEKKVFGSHSQSFDKELDMLLKCGHWPRRDGGDSTFLLYLLRAK